MATITAPAVKGAAPRAQTAVHVEAGAARPGMTLDRVLAIVGTLMLPVGFAAIFLGYLGAAGTGFLFEQVPYLISGGLLGIGLVLGGGTLYLGSWVAKLAAQQREESAKVRELLVEIRDGLGQAPRSSPFARPDDTTEIPMVGGFVATQSGTLFHRPDCPVVLGRDNLRRVSSSDGLAPCKLCDPA